MNNMYIDIFGDVKIYFGNDLIDDLLPDEPFDKPMEDEEKKTEAELSNDEDVDISGLLISVDGLPVDINRENVEEIVSEFADLLKEEMRKAAASRK